MFFRKRVVSNRDNWELIASRICMILEQFYTEWYSSSIKQITRLYNVKNKDLKDEGLLETKAYFLYMVCLLIASKRYITPNDAHDFTVLLQLEFFGEHVDAIKPFYLQYPKHMGDPKKAADIYIHNMTKYITGMEEHNNPRVVLGTNGCLQMTTPMCLNSINSSVALCFGDKKTAKTFDKYNKDTLRIIAKLH